MSTTSKEADTGFYFSSIMTKTNSVKQPTSTVISVTPDMAAAWLANECDFQRSTSSSVVTRYADLMRKGQWKLTHQGVALDNCMRVIDGRHRLKAIIESSKTIDLMVTFNADPDTFDSLDRGYTRTLGQLVSMSGMQWAHTWHIAAANALHWELGKTGSINKTWAPHDLTTILTHYENEFRLCFPAGLSGSEQFRNAAVRGPY